MPSIKEQNSIQRNSDLIVRYVRAFAGPGLNKISELTTHILVSNIENASQPSQLKEYGIEAILYIGLIKKSPELLNSYRKKKIEHHHISFPDIEETNDKVPKNLIPFLDQSYQIIHNYVSNERKILVHCLSGLSLSVSVILYYLLNRYYLTNFKIHKNKTKELIDYEISFLPKLVRFLKEMRPCISPHPSYIHQLLLRENQMKKYFANILTQEMQEYKKKQKLSQKSRNKKISKNKEDENENKEDENETEDESGQEDIYPDESGDENIDHYLDKLDEIKLEEKRSRSAESVKAKPKKIRYDQLEDLFSIERSDAENESENEGENDHEKIESDMEDLIE